MAFCKLLTVLLLIHNTGGVLGAEGRSSIVGGQDAVELSWPWMAMVRPGFNISVKWLCGGSIISRDYVLTSASCWDRNPAPVNRRSGVWVGAYQLENGASRYMFVAEVIRHDGYRRVGSGYVNDIALVRLTKKLEFGKNYSSVLLAGVDDTSLSDCWITGWGNIKAGVPLPYPQTLQQLKVAMFKQSECKPVYPGLTSDQLCAGDKHGGKDACQGDNGGPLVCRSATGYKQVGIMSYGSCGQPGHPSVYTVVSKHLDFIKKYVHIGQEASAEV